MKKLLTIVVPVFNEEENLLTLHKAIAKEVNKLNSYNHEIIFVNDGSTDSSGEVIEGLAKSDRHIKYLEFSRNFGKEIATSAGLFHASGDAAMMMDADMQFPPELISEFVKKWEKGAEVVTGIRQGNEGEGIVKKTGSVVFNKVINMLNKDIIPDSTDYRLLDKKVVEAFKNFTERNRMTRGLIDWLGFKKDFIYFSANKRLKGEVSYNFPKLIGLFMASIVSLSKFPLKFAGYLGIALTFFAGLLGFFLIVEQLILNDPLSLNFSGVAMLAVVILFAVGIILMGQGLLALYIDQIHTEATNRPIFVLRKTIGNLNENIIKDAYV